MASGRVHNGQVWSDVTEHAFQGNHEPVHPMLDGDGKIFVSIPSFRDGERCGKTLVDLFAKAKDPDSIVVGLIEQNYEEDKFCLEQYCEDMGAEVYERREIRADTTKVIAKPERKECRRVDQIRKLSVHNVAAKGPVWARSLTRKVLGNEEFCLQLDAHMEFAQDWDDKLKHEWAATGNEFGIISTVPASLAEKEDHTVPRQCQAEFLDVGVPHYTARGDGKVENLKKPLLSHAWSAGFSFSKCHLEESAPYDPFTPYVMGLEQFARYARFWTRGYDTYTPTQNIVYHNFQTNPDGHGAMEWMRPRRERFRQKAIERIKSVLELPDGEEGLNLSNLGIYGLGKRRTLKQMADFVGIEMDSQTSRDPSGPCGDDQWVPYNANISPVENLHDQPDNLDPQPEFPLRTEFAFYKEEVWEPPVLEILEGDALDSGKDATMKPGGAVVESPFPSVTLLLILWMLGLTFWCSFFLPSSAPPESRVRRKAREYKDV